jgi:molecular chaperone GrpE
MSNANPEVENGGPVIRDKRRIDPTTGALREPGATRAPAAPAPAPTLDRATSLDEDQLSAVRQELAERTTDLQRLQAEYVNYRRRVERDRESVREQALANVLISLLPVLDDIGRARDHGELEGGFKAVADSLELIVGKLGLTRFGEPGEPFDPTVHEALMHTYDETVTESTAVTILQPGYRIGQRVVRPARVAVAEPAGSS